MSAESMSDNSTTTIVRCRYGICLFVVFFFQLGVTRVVAESGSRQSEGSSTRSTRSARSNGPSMAQVVKQSKRSGMPIFAVSVSDTCPACQALLRTLRSDESLQPYLAQFVPLEINVDGPDFRTWERSFPRQSSSIPGVYVVSATGKQVFGDEGAMRSPALKKMMLTSLEKLRRYPTEAEWQTLTETVAAVEAALANGNQDEALRLLQPVLPSIDSLGTLAELSDVGKKAQELTNQLVEQQQAEFDQARQEFASSSTWPAALQLARIEHLLSTMPSLRQQIQAEIKTAAKTTEQRKLLRQARELHAAERLAREPNREKQARRALNKIVKRYPDTPAATRAEQVILTVGSSRVSSTADRTAAAADELRVWSDSTGKFTITARLLEVKNDRVRLEQTDGKVLTIPLSKLDREGQRIAAENSGAWGS